MGKHKQIEDSLGEEMHSELVLGLSGERDAEWTLLFNVAHDAIAEKDYTSGQLVLDFMQALARHKPDMLDGYIERGQQCSKETGWQLVARNEHGMSVWYEPTADVLALQRCFYTTT